MPHCFLFPVGSFVFSPQRIREIAEKYYHRALFVLIINDFRMQNADPGIIPSHPLSSPFPSSSDYLLSFAFTKVPKHWLDFLSAPCESSEATSAPRLMEALLFSASSTMQPFPAHLLASSYEKHDFRTLQDPLKTLIQGPLSGCFYQTHTFLLYKPGTFLFHWVGPHIISLRL